MRAQAYNVRDAAHPVQKEIQKCLGAHTLTAVVEEDMQTLAAMKHVEGLVAFLCTLTKDGRIIAQGRGGTVLSPTNRFIGRAIAYAFNSALADAAIRATKVLDTFRDKTEIDVEEAYASKESEPATERQRDFLRQLVRVHVEDESEREQWESRLTEFTKTEASKAIETFRS